ncbi:radical SAM protein [Candidatus Margulisiibacteriota bacterium]
MNPKICQFYITLKCNATCEFCDIWHRSEYQDAPEITAMEHEKGLKALRRKGVEELRITGGEPLLYDELPQVLKIAKELGFKISLFTNCYHYPERAKEIKNLVNTFYFSIDYPYPEQHNRSRGRSLFNNIIRSIEKATHLKENIVMFYTVTRDSILYLPEIVEFCDKFSVNVILNPVYDFAGTQGFNPDSIDYMRYFGRRKNVFVNLALLQFIASRGNSIAFPRCRARESVVTMLPSGKTVAPCFYNQGGKQGKESVCISCMRWPYMLPSFTIGFDRYKILDLYSKRLWSKRSIKLEAIR